MAVLNPTEVHQVEMLDGTEFETGRFGVTKMWITDDGLGPLGHYDRVHILVDDRHTILPAHNLAGWATKQ